MQKKLLYLSIFFLTAFSNYSVAQHIKMGNWGGQIIYDSVVVPFDFTVRNSTWGQEIVLNNGEEEIVLSGLVNRNDSMLIPLGVFDAQLIAKVEENKISGFWEKNYRDSKVAFIAKFNSKRYVDPNSKVNKLENLWQMTFKPHSPTAYNAIGIWKQNNNRITGSIITGVGDFRYFEGILKEDSIIASSFDGAHAFLIKGVRDEKGWKGRFYFESGYSENWEAFPDESPTIESQFTKVEEKMHRPFFDILAAGSGGLGVIDESKYFNKVLIIQLFGTWCPNSLDATRFLQKWYSENQNKDVEILAITYEPKYSQEYAQSRINEYKKNLGVDYDVLIGGRLSKSEAALAFPYMSKIEAFPTLVIVDRDGFVHAAFNYFTGPATGIYYEEFKNQFNQVINNLLEE